MAKDKEERTPKSSKATSGQETKEESTKPEVSGKFNDFIKKIEEMSVKDLNVLVGDLEATFGPIVIASGGSGGDGGAGEAGAEEKSEYDIELTSAGSSAIQVIKAVKDYLKAVMVYLPERLLCDQNI